MPIYQYQCPSCKHKFEIKQGFHDESSASCPKCKKNARRLFIPVPIVFKGSGFYVTDSAKKSEVQDFPKEPKAEKEAKSEVKAEVKAEAKGGSKVESEKKVDSEKKAESKVSKAS